MASACNNLAEFYRLRRRYDDAEPLYKQVRRAGPTRAPSPALSLGRAAGTQPTRIVGGGAVHQRECLSVQMCDHFCTPPPLYAHACTPPPRKQALEILTRTYGLHDARVAFALHNLGGFYFIRRQVHPADAPPPCVVGCHAMPCRGVPLPAAAACRRCMPVHPRPTLSPPPVMTAGPRRRVLRASTENEA